MEELDDSYWFSYSVRMRLLDPASGQTDALSSCQLSDRHWVIRANDTVVAEVRGRAVIGMVCGSLFVSKLLYIENYFLVLILSPMLTR